MGKIISELSTNIYNNPVFRTDYEKLAKFALTKKNELSLELNQIKRLMESASIFSLSNDSKHQKLAFKIAIFMLNKLGKDYSIIPVATELILTRLGDLPTLNHMYSETDGTDYFSYFHVNGTSDMSILKFPEVAAKKILNQFEIPEKAKWTLTDFQASIFHNLLSGKNLSFSAPTSAGKSFVIHNYISYKMLNSSNFKVVYLVPTKALIAEVQESITEKLRKLGINYEDTIVVNSTDYFNMNEFSDIQKCVLVLTPERLQFAHTHGTDLKIDLLVVDEAQKVRDEERGVILEDSVTELITANPEVQAVFISPYISNPMKFSKIFNIKEIHPIVSAKTPVGQNIFYITVKKNELISSLYSDEFGKEIIELERVPLEKKLPTSQYKLKSLIVKELLKGQGHTLVYCNLPSECVKVANEISEVDTEIDESPEIAKAIDFLKSHVHEQYYLSDHLKFRIGYHYGRMPQFVRFVVKDLFDNEKIDFLCCTSTLLEGVNLPAKNIILYKPKAGQRNPMDKFSIKNLAGRAGRLGQDYYGNIYCVDIDKWDDVSDVFDDELESIESTVEKTLSLDLDFLIEHLTNYTPPVHGKKNVTAVATSLIIKQLKDNSGNFLTSLGERYGITSDRIAVIRSLLIKISERISDLDSNIMIRNRSIDPRLQHALYVHLKDKSNFVIPPYPWFEKFYDDLLEIFKMIQGFIFQYDKSLSNYKYFTFVAHQWINQQSYKRILENRLSYVKDQKHRNLTKGEINQNIDRVDEILESVLKYDYTRGLRCYCDIAEYLIKKRNLQVEYSKELPDYLETGAYDKRVFLLLGSGLSRNSAISISHHMPETIESIPNCIRWLKSNQEKIKTIIHELAYRELDYILKSNKF